MTNITDAYDINNILLQEARKRMIRHQTSLMAKPEFCEHIGEYGEMGIKELPNGIIYPSIYTNKFKYDF